MPGNAVQVGWLDPVRCPAAAMCSMPRSLGRDCRSGSGHIRRGRVIPARSGGALGRAATDHRPAGAPCGPNTASHGVMALKICRPVAARQSPRQSPTGRGGIDRSNPATRADLSFVKRWRIDGRATAPPWKFNRIGEYAATTWPPSGGNGPRSPRHPVCFGRAGASQSGRAIRRSERDDAPTPGCRTGSCSRCRKV